METSQHVTNPACVIIPDKSSVDVIFGLQIIEFLFGIDQIKLADENNIDIDDVRNKMNENWWILGIELSEPVSEYYYPGKDERISIVIYQKYKHVLWDDYLQTLDEKCESLNFDVLDKIFMFKLRHEIFNVNPYSSTCVHNLMDILSLQEQRKLCVAILATILKQTLQLEANYRKYRGHFLCDIEASKNGVLVCKDNYPVNNLLYIFDKQVPFYITVQPLVSGKYITTQVILPHVQKEHVYDDLTDAKWAAWQIANKPNRGNVITRVLKKISWYWFKWTT